MVFLMHIGRDNSKKKFKMKRILFFIMYLHFVSCSSQMSQRITFKQTKIPLNNSAGIPFQYEQNSYIIDGFEVDKDRNFYFMAGKLDWKKATLVVYSGTKLKYRKEYKEIHPSKLYLYKNRLYSFDHLYIESNNSLFVIDTATGSIINKYEQIIKNKINSIEYVDTTIIAETFDDKKNIDIKTQMVFVAFDLSGKIIQQVSNPFNLPEIIYHQAKGAQYLGQWKEHYVYLDYIYNDDRLKDDYIKFWLLDKEGKKIADTTLTAKLTGAPYYGNPNECRKLRNESIFILGVEGKNALITELPLKILFKEVEK